MVRLRAGDVEVNSSIIRNSLNPNGIEPLSLGFLLSAMEIKVDIYDHDIGVEMEDDLMVSDLLEYHTAAPLVQIILQRLVIRYSVAKLMTPCGRPQTA